MFRAVFILFIFTCGTCLSQFAQLSRYEKCWAIGHPVAAFKVKKITAQCYKIYKPSQLKSPLDSFSNGGKLDAFRHVFFMAAYAQKIKTKKLRKLGIAHEKANYRQFLHARQEEGEAPDSLGSVMDLKNNELGLLLGSPNKKINLNELKTLAISAINAGSAVIIKRNKTGNYVTCNGEIIDGKFFYNVWYVPKCLIASN